MIHHARENKSHHSYLWLSFALGSVIGASGLFLIGTTQGRKLLKRAMEIAETLEESAADLVGRIEEEAEDKGQKIRQAIEPIISNSNLQTVLDKIQTTVLPHHKESKKS